jgi:septal ring factor EnvC (AmiA/AmiB activator)
VTVSALRPKLVALVLLAACALVAAVLLGHDQAQGQTIAGQQATAEQLRAAVRAESRRIAATAEGIASAEQRLAVLDARVQRRQAQATDAQDRLIDARVRLSRLERNADAYAKTLASTLLAQYKTPRPDLLGVAVQAKGFDDLLSQLRFLREISDRNATVLRDTRRARAEVKDQTAQLKRLRTRLIAAARDAQADRERADVLRNALLRRQAQQLSRRASSQSRLRTVRARIASLERRQAAEAQRQAASQDATQQAPPAPAPGGPPVQGDDAVARVVAAANEIATTPYVWGGGHGGSASGGYDCSGSLSYALAAAGLVNGSLTSGGFMSWGEPGPGRRITVYANAGHAYMVVDGRRYDTSALSGGGTRWTSAMRSSAGFVARHPPGL